MADKTYEIEIKTTSDTAGVTSVKEALTETKEEADEVNSSMEQMGESVNNIDSSSIDDLNQKTQETTDSTSEATDSTDQLGVSITSIDPSVIDQLRDSMAEYSNTAKEGADSTNDLMEGLVSGGVATGLAGTFMGLADSAGSYNDSMLRMGLALEGHAMTVDEVSEKYGASVSRVADATGRGAGSVRNHFTNMAVAGVTSQDTLESSFQAIANGSFYSGESVETLSNKFQRITMTGMLSAKQLSSLGLTMEDLASVMGVSAEEVSDKFKTMTAEQRASVMSQASANKYGTEVNDVFKNSWEGLWVQLDKAKQGLERITGELILPYLIPAVQTATFFIKGLADVFKSLPSPVKAVFGGILLLMGSITTLGLGLNAVMKIGKMVISPFTSLAKLFGIDLNGKALKLASTLKTSVLNAFRSLAEFVKQSLIPALRNAGSSLLTMGKNALISGYNALKSAGMWVVEKAQTVASTLARWGATASQWALNVAMSMNPIGLLVIAIVGLIAVLGYLYFNNEQVRQAIDGLGQALIGIGQVIYGFLQTAWNTLLTTLQNVWNYITTLGGLLPQQVSITGNQIIDGILGVIGFMLTLPFQIAMIFANIIAKAMGFGDNFVQRMISAGTKSVTNFMNSIATLPSKLANELNNMLSTVGQWASTLPAKFWEAGVNAVKNFLNALGIASPGTMQRMLIWEVNEMGRRVPLESRNLLSNVSDLGENIVDEFGNPSLSLETASLGNASLTTENANGVGQVNNFYFSDVTIDSEDRMEEIYKYITKKLYWNNTTAGRTI